MEKCKIREEDLARSKEEHIKRLLESESKLKVLTGGLEFDVFQKVRIHDNQKRQEELAKECSICMDGEINCVTVPCGHKIMCLECCESLVENKKPCPICRTPITSYNECN
eukprot:TRINITY_DN8179_c0_g2_i1.p1 TRINITY_DN8179_c0_g2~~TRINITY_DN8179_c0_g2_i1.p1  ORF type:complete len:129 (+),score=28.04 TRINITY_DN8179_c0_g2_i1:59-388(+)